MQYQTPPVITVYFDISSLDPKKVTGVGVYMLQLIENLKNNPAIHLVPVLKLSRYKKKKLLEDFLQQEVTLLWPWTGAFKKNALYHGPDFKVLMGPRMPRLVTIHDMVVFAQKFNAPQFYKRGIKDLTKVLKSNIEGIIVNSRFTESEVLKHFPELKNKTHVTLLGCDRQYPAPEHLTPSLGEYILFLGTLEKRKNVLGAIKAFEILCSEGFGGNLVLAGAWGTGSEEIKSALENSPAKKQIKHLSYVPNNQVEGLFKNAKAFVFPSWYEGFGIPVLEAMSLGCPVVTSTGGVLEEITGGAALHADPSKPESIAKALNTLLQSDSLRDDLIKKGHQQAAQFTWKRCAEETLQVYKNILNQAQN
ncbi:MAG: glycosyltransferase family 4 protein [Bacillota bacterium]